MRGGHAAVHAGDGRGAPARRARVRQEAVGRWHRHRQRSQDWGYTVRREPTDDDLTVLQLLRTDVVGGGVPKGQAGPATRMRAHFDYIAS
jgi:hypothetical protein